MLCMSHIDPRFKSVQKIVVFVFQWLICAMEMSKLHKAFKRIHRIITFADIYQRVFFLPFIYFLHLSHSPLIFISFLLQCKISVLFGIPTCDVRLGVAWLDWLIWHRANNYFSFLRSIFFESSLYVFQIVFAPIMVIVRWLMWHLIVCSVFQLAFFLYLFLSLYAMHSKSPLKTNGKRRRNENLCKFLLSSHWRA